MVTKVSFFEDIEVVYPDGTVKTRGGYNDREYNVDGDDVLVPVYGAVNITDVDKETKAGCVVIYNNPLVYRVKNKETIKGIISIVIDEQPTIWAIDFGDGKADNQMSVSDGKDTWTVNIIKLD